MTLFYSKLLLCGTGEYSIADFKSNHIVNGGSPEFRRVLGKQRARVTTATSNDFLLHRLVLGCNQQLLSNWNGTFAAIYDGLQSIAARRFPSKTLSVLKTFIIYFELPNRNWIQSFKLLLRRLLLIACLQPTHASINCVCLTTRATSSSSERWLSQSAKATKASEWVKLRAIRKLHKKTKSVGKQ